VDDWKLIAGGGTGLTTVIFAVHYLRNTSRNMDTAVMSVTKSLDAIVSNMAGMREGMNQLNIKLATVIADRQNDKDQINELRSDMKQLQKEVSQRANLANIN